MRTIENSVESSHPPDSPWLQKADSYRCKHCGSPDNVIACYTEVTTGTADVVDIDGELDNYEGYETDGFEVSQYECRWCGFTAINLSSIAVDPEYDPEECQ